jgi:hypothetical protein
LAARIAQPLSSELTPSADRWEDQIFEHGNCASNTENWLLRHPINSNSNRLKEYAIAFDRLRLFDCASRKFYHVATVPHDDRPEAPRFHSVVCAKHGTVSIDIKDIDRKSHPKCVDRRTRVDDESRSGWETGPEHQPFPPLPERPGHRNALA